MKGRQVTIPNASAVTSMSDRLCVALDLEDRDEILRVAGEVSDVAGYVKVNSAFVLHGPGLVRDLHAMGARVFMDLKLHDIPNTMAAYGRAVTRLGAAIVTIHPAGGLEMMRATVAAARESALRAGTAGPKLIGIALLTSVDDKVLNEEVGVPGPAAAEVLRKSLLAAEAGLDGVVCAPAEIERLRGKLPDDFLYVTPGTRSPGDSEHDHKRSATHAQAIESGSSLLVVGRRILHAPDRRKAALEVLEEMKGGTA